MKRKNPLCTGSTHHVYSKSISHFQIFNSTDEYLRFFNLICYYRLDTIKTSFSQISRNASASYTSSLIQNKIQELSRGNDHRVTVFAFCIMPTHFHLILNQKKHDGIKRFLSDVCNSYTHYFNLRHNRKGPLWQNRFGNTPIYNAQELIETSKYVHLNPTTAFLTDHPASWPYSSIHEYIGKATLTEICRKEDVLGNIQGRDYEKALVEEIETQRDRKRNQKH